MPGSSPFNAAKHRCELQSSHVSKISPWQQLKKYAYSWIQIYDNNPLCTKYFRSEKKITEEKRRHSRSAYWYVVHPLSRFRICYEIYLIVLYLAAVWLQFFDFGLLRRGELYAKRMYDELIIIINIVNVLCWVDIIMNFFVGYYNKKAGAVELNQIKIAIHYVGSHYFICDVLSSIPKHFICLPVKCHQLVYTSISFLSLLKIVRLISVQRLVKRVCRLFKIHSQNLIIAINFFTLMATLAHIVACFYFGAARIGKWTSHNNKYLDDSFVIHNKLLEKKLFTRYMLSLFKTNANALSMDMDFNIILWYEQVLMMVNYTGGKVLMCCVWIMITDALMATRASTTLLMEKMTQLEQWMRHKKLPESAKVRIRTYINYKYPQKTYVDESNLRKILNPRINAVITVHSCRKFIQNCPLFDALSSAEIKEVVQYFTSEIFLPNDVIIQSGTIGDSICFIRSGTVAVYSHSGSEICHLYDASYFGEVALVMQEVKRSATVTAVEITEIYRLERKHFTKYFLSKKEIHDSILKKAQEMMAKTREAERKYKEFLMNQKIAAESAVGSTATRNVS